MTQVEIPIIIAGHICIDIIPNFYQIKENFKSILIPGKLINVGPVTISPGGPVSNTGIALHQLDVPLQLMGKIGDDVLGNVLIKLLRSYGDCLAEGVIVAKGNNTSYTIVINPSGIDRMFFHHPGANDTFQSQDIDFNKIKDSRIFHFGYPPLMRRMYINEGRELKDLLKRAKEHGLVTSLDMAYPDPESESGHVDWKLILKRILPYVDIFQPSLDEIMFMLNISHINNMTYSKIGDLLLDLGVGIIAIKLGDQGLYLRTSTKPERLEFLNICGYEDTRLWCGRELFTTCFKVEVVGTTGSGDCTVAGLLAGLTKHLDIIGVLTSAVAVGACSVEAMDSTSGIQSWEIIQNRIQQGWDKYSANLDSSIWKYDEKQKIWIGPYDKVQ